jgi:hypothetical protein
MPGGIPAISRHAIEMANKWRETHQDRFDPNAAYDPVSGHEAIPDAEKAQVLEARLWRTVLIEAAPAVGANFDPLQNKAS